VSIACASPENVTLELCDLSFHHEASAYGASMHQTIIAQNPQYEEKEKR
jgi:hypothetical protein